MTQQPLTCYDVWFRCSYSDEHLDSNLETWKPSAVSEITKKQLFGLLMEQMIIQCFCSSFNGTKYRGKDN